MLTNLQSWIRTQIIMKNMPVILGVIFLLLTPSLVPLALGEASNIGERVSSATDQAKETIQDASQAAMDQIDGLWRSIDERRLKNRTRDEIVAWIVMGLLAGGLLSRVSGFRPVAAFVFGLIGAFLGGLIVHLTKFDLGLGPIFIRYEDLIFALLGAIVVAVVAKLATKKPKFKKE